MPCDFVNSRPSSVSSSSPNANETAGVVAAAAAVRSPGVASPGMSPGAASVMAPTPTSAHAGDGSVGDMSMPPDPSAAAAAFAFLEWSLNATRDGPVVGDPQAAFAQMPQAHALDPMFDVSPFPQPLGAPVACLAAEDDLAMNMTDLSLLHHFTTSTACELNPWHTGLQEWWIHEVPRVAFRYPFVMRALLALAGLHVAYQSQQRQQQQASSPAATTTATAGASSASASGAAAPAGIPMVGIGTGPAASPSESYHSGMQSDAAERAFHISRAIEQHKLAGQTASSMLLDLNRSTSAPMYVFSVVTLIISMAMPRPQPAAAVRSWGSVGVLEWVRLMRGVKTIADLGETWLTEGDMLLGTFNEKVLPRALQREQREQQMRRGRATMSGFAAFSARGSSGGGSSTTTATSTTTSGTTTATGNKRRSRWYLMHEPPLTQMREAVLSGHLDAADGSEDAAEVRQLCVKALDNLQHVFQSFLDHGESVQTVRLIFSWLCQVDQLFLDSLSRHNPACLLLFSYFGVLLHWTDRAWWMEVWGPHIVESISSILGGAADMPAQFKEWLKWPREQIGLPSLG